MGAGLSAFALPVLIVLAFRTPEQKSIVWILAGVSLLAVGCAFGWFWLGRVPVQAGHAKAGPVKLGKSPVAGSGIVGPEPDRCPKCGSVLVAHGFLDPPRCPKCV